MSDEWSKGQLLEVLHKLVIEIRVNLNETDRLALGLSTGKTSEDQFIENHENLINDAESALEILKEMVVMTKSFYEKNSIQRKF